nr:hypothetical protein [Tanacetum cinerariifolium]
MRAVANRELPVSQVAHALQIPPVGQLQGETCGASGKTGLGIQLGESGFDRRDVAAMAIEEKYFFKAVACQRTRPVADGGNEGRWAQGNRAGKAQMVLRHANVESRRDENVGALLRFVGNDLRAHPVRAEQTGGAVLFVGTDRYDDRAAALEKLLDFDPGAVVQKHVRSSSNERFGNRWRRAGTANSKAVRRRSSAIDTHACGTAGKRATKQVPDSADEFTVSVPSWAVAICEAIYKPSPRPSPRPPASERVNGSNSSGIIRAEMGVPRLVGQQLADAQRVAVDALAQADPFHKDRLRLGRPDLLHRRCQHVGEVIREVALHRDTTAHAPASEIQHVFDQYAHANRALPDGRYQPQRALVFGLGCQQVGAHANGTQRRAQVVTQHRHELLAQPAVLIGVAQFSACRVQMALSVQAHGNQLREQGQRLDDGRVVQVGRHRIDGAQGAEKATVGQHDGEGNVAFQTVRKGRMVDSNTSSPPGLRPKLIESSTAQATQWLSVTRATAAKRMPVRCLTMLKTTGTAGIALIASTSNANSGRVIGSGSESACGETAKLPFQAGVGPQPQLPEPNSSLIPTVKVSKAVGWNGTDTPKAAEGFKVSALAENLDHPRWLYSLPNGDILVAESNKPPKPEGAKDGGSGVMAWIKRTATGIVMSRVGAEAESANRISILRDADGDGRAEMKKVFLSGLTSPFGMVLVGNELFIANADAVVKVPYNAGQTESTSTPVKVTDLPAGINHHWTKNIIANREGTKLYVTVGSNSNVAENGLEAEEGRAAVWEVDVKTGQKRLFASGLRNPNGLAWKPGSNELRLAVELLRQPCRQSSATAAPGHGRQGHRPRLRPRHPRCAAGPDLVRRARHAGELLGWRFHWRARFVEPQSAIGLQSGVRRLQGRSSIRHAGGLPDRVPERRRRCPGPASGRDSRQQRRIAGRRRRGQQGLARQPGQIRPSVR